MIDIAFSTSFRRAYRKKLRTDSQLQLKLMECLILFMKDPYHPKLKTHRLSGSLHGLWNFSVEYDIRVVFYFKNDKEAIFENIGSHDEVY